MKTTLCLSLFAWLAWLGPEVRAQEIDATPPRLSARPLAGQSVRLAWPRTATGFALEQSERLSASIAWQPVTPVAQIEGEEFAVTVVGREGNRFFRLRGGQSPLTTIAQTSPVDGETGVAVTRETIVFFSSPLAADIVLTTNHFYAGFGGRRILSRVELASDRRKATLFYLEPLPGGTRVSAVFNSEGLTDSQGRPLDLSGTGQTGGLKLFQFETLSLTPVGTTAVSGRIFASELVLAPILGPTPSTSHWPM